MISFTGTPSSWNELVASLPLAHLLQTWEWSLVKTRYGWKALPFVWQRWFREAGRGSDGFETQPSGSRVCKKNVRALRPERSAAWTGRILTCVIKVLEDLCTFAKRQGAIFIKIDADVVLGTGVPGAADAVRV